MKIILLVYFIVFCFQSFSEIPFEAYERCKKSSGLSTTKGTSSKQIKLQVYHLCLEKERKKDEYLSKIVNFCNKKYSFNSPVYNDCIDCLAKRTKPAKNFIENPKGVSCLIELQDYSGIKKYDENFLSSKWYKDFLKEKLPPKGESVTRKISTEK